MQTAFDWISFFKTHKHSGKTLSGYYNDNVILESPEGMVVVRTPVPHPMEMDIRVATESKLLKLLPKAIRASNVIWASDSGDFQVHSFIRGDVVNDLYPRGKVLPHHFLTDVAKVLSQLYAIPVRTISPCFPTWRMPNNNTDFYKTICTNTHQVFKRCNQSHPQIYNVINLTEYEVSEFCFKTEILGGRPNALCHSDIHRKNCIINHRKTYFLDWELALIGDPLYDIAVHIHKMGYRKFQETELLKLLANTLPEEHLKNSENDLSIYLEHEIIKSVTVDSVRYYDIISHPNTHENIRIGLTNKLAKKLLAASNILSINPLGPDEILFEFKSIIST